MGLCLSSFYRTQLLDDVIPFWQRHSLDERCGGYLTCLDRQGVPFNDDKGIWLQARQVWMFSKLYNTLEQRPEWLNVARLGYRFLRDHGFSAEGRAYFAVTRDGRPLRLRRYLFSEAFCVIACAEYARASGDAQALALAKRTFELVWRLYQTPDALPPKVIPSTRRTKALAMPMILLATAQELRLCGDGHPLYAAVVAHSLGEIRGQFLKREERALHEVVGPRGERLDSPEGRCLNPGHAIEASWFMLHEAQQCHDETLARDALDILDWSLERGWDPAYDGLLAFVDIEGRPPEPLEWDMKLWWPHNEALIATLMACLYTGQQRYLDWHERIRAYAFSHFADPKFGEWFGYLHRDGSLANELKGSLWKGAFHVPRALWRCWQLASAAGL